MKKEKSTPVKKTKSDSETELTAVETPATAAENEAVAPTVNKVGALLKEMRQRKNLKLTDISKKLCVRKFYLEAIEESRYEDIPEFPYGIGFIRSYADYLGLNSSNIIELYKEETESKPDKDIFVLEPQAEATVPGKKYLLISLLALVLIYILWSMYNNRINVVSEQNPDEILPVSAVEEIGAGQPLVVEDYSVGIDSADSKPRSEPLAYVEPAIEAPLAENVVVTEQAFPGMDEAPAAVQPTAPAAEPQTAQPAAELAAPAKGVMIKINDETWVEVKDDARLYLSKVLQAGDSYVVPNEGRGIILSIGRPSAAEVLINGKVTEVATSAKKTNIALDKFLNATH